MQPLYLAFDAALAALSLRSLAVLGPRAPWTSVGWIGTAGYCAAAIVEFSSDPLHRLAGSIAFGFLLLLTAAFVVAGVRDEPQAEPLLWPVRVGKTRAEKRAQR